MWSFLQPKYSLEIIYIQVVSLKYYTILNYPTYSKAIFYSRDTVSLTLKVIFDCRDTVSLTLKVIFDCRDTVSLNLKVIFDCRDTVSLTLKCQLCKTAEFFPSAKHQPMGGQSWRGGGPIM